MPRPRKPRRGEQLRLPIRLPRSRPSPRPVRYLTEERARAILEQLRAERTAERQPPAAMPTAHPDELAARGEALRAHQAMLGRLAEARHEARRKAKTDRPSKEPETK